MYDDHEHVSGSQSARGLPPLRCAHIHPAPKRTLVLAMWALSACSKHAGAHTGAQTNRNTGSHGAAQFSGTVTGSQWSSTFFSPRPPRDHSGLRSHSHGGPSDRNPASLPFTAPNRTRLRWAQPAEEVQPRFDAADIVLHARTTHGMQHATRTLRRRGTAQEALRVPALALRARETAIGGKLGYGRP